MLRTYAGTWQDIPLRGSAISVVRLDGESGYLIYIDTPDSIAGHLVGDGSWKYEDAKRFAKMLAVRAGQD